MKRAITWILVAVVLLVVVFYVGGGFYFASRINSGALAVQQPLDKAVEVVDVAAREITLRERVDDIPALELDATYGLAWDSGHGEISGPPRDISGSERTQVTRSFRVTGGTAPSEGGTVRVDRDVYPEEDPAEALDTGVGRSSTPHRQAPSVRGTSPAVDAPG